jgi:dTDP-glucose pyrophosphorylase
MELAPYKKHLLQKGCSIREALERLDFLASDAILFVVTEEEKLVGSLTDGDIRRGLLKGYTIANVVDDIIQSSPRYIRKGEYNIEKVIEYRENNFRIIPIVDKENKIVNVVNFREFKSYLPIDAVIMAGGRGERLRPLTDNIPKPLLKIGTKPIIEYNLDRLRLFGIDDFWISVNYLGEQIEAFIGDGNGRNINVQYVKENSPLGTIGAVSLIKNFQHDYILVSNSDLLTDLNYELFFLDFLKANADFSVVTIPYQVNVPYAVLETSNGHIVDFKEKPTYTYYSNGGIYLIKKDILGFIPEETCFNATDLMEILIKNNKIVISYPMEGYWLDIGKSDDFEKAQKDINRIKF